MKRSKACGRFEVTADGQGMTGLSGTALLAETADRIGLTAGLSRSVGRCRSWIAHDPGKVVRDLVVMLAHGGDALRHMKILDASAAEARGPPRPSPRRSVSPSTTSGATARNEQLSQ